MISEHIIGGLNYLNKEAREASFKRQHYNCKLNDKQKQASTGTERVVGRSFLGRENSFSEDTEVGSSLIRLRNWEKAATV